jgi:hypothetical protein
MADQENINNTRRQNEMYDAQVSTLEALNRLAQQRVVFEGQVADEISNENDILREQLNIANKQKDGRLKNLAQQRELNKVNNQTLGIARSIQSVTASELGSQKLIEKVQKDRLKVQKNIDFLQKAAQKTYSEDEKLNQAIQNSILAQADAAKKLIEELNTVKEVSEAIANDGFLSIFDTLKKVINIIPGLRDLLPGFDQAAESYREALVIAKQPGSFVGLGENQAEELNKKIQAYREGDAEGTKGMTKDFIKDLPKDLQDTLKGTTGTASLAILSNKFKDGVATAVSPLRAAFLSLQKFLKNFILLQFLNAIVKADKATGDLARSMNITYQESTGVMENFNAIANSSNNAFITTKGLAETQMAINKELGTSVVLSDKVLQDFTMLREQAGFTNEELAGVRAITLATGGDAEKLTGEIMAQARITSSRLGVVINERDVVKDISKVSAATTLTLGQSSEAIAKAVTTAKALGFELSQIEGIASSILDFESSIENELSAELLIGKELNLERARFAALNGDIETVTKEIASQMGSAAEFGKMNVIQQEALAKALGMNREDLAKSLYVQEQLAGVSGEEAKLREKAINARIAEVGLAQTQQEIADGQLEKIEHQNSVQERLLAVTEKINEIFVSLAEPILAIVSPIVDALVPALSFVAGILGKVANLFGGILGYVVPIVGAMYTLQAVSSAILGIQTAYNTAKALELGLGGSILSVLGLQNAAMVYKITLQETGNVLSAIGAAIEETKLGAIIAQGVSIVYNIAKETILLGIKVAQAAAALVGVSASTLGIGTVIALAAAAAGIAYLHSITNTDDLMSMPTAGSGYGDRILVGPEGAYAFNNRDTIQASTKGSPTSNTGGNEPAVTTKLYIDNQKFAEASTLGFSKL